MDALLNQIMHGQSIDFNELDTYLRNMVDVLDAVREEPLEGNSFEEKLRHFQAEILEIMESEPEEATEEDQANWAAQIRAIDLWRQLRRT